MPGWRAPPWANPALGGSRVKDGKSHRKEPARQSCDIARNHLSFSSRHRPRTRHQAQVIGDGLVSTLASQSRIGCSMIREPKTDEACEGMAPRAGLCGRSSIKGLVGPTYLSTVVDLKRLFRAVANRCSGLFSDQLKRPGLYADRVERALETRRTGVFGNTSGPHGDGKSHRQIYTVSHVFPTGMRWSQTSDDSRASLQRKLLPGRLKLDAEPGATNLEFAISESAGALGGT